MSAMREGRGTTMRGRKERGKERKREREIDRQDEKREAERVKMKEDG